MHTHLHPLSPPALALMLSCTRTPTRRQMRVLKAGHTSRGTAVAALRRREWVKRHTFPGPAKAIGNVSSCTAAIFVTTRRVGERASEGRSHKAHTHTRNTQDLRPR
jgi:hypothetical protein